MRNYEKVSNHKMKRKWVKSSELPCAIYIPEYIPLVPYNNILSHKTSILYTLSNGLTFGNKFPFFSTSIITEYIDKIFGTTLFNILQFKKANINLEYTMEQPWYFGKSECKICKKIWLDSEFSIESRWLDWNTQFYNLSLCSELCEIMYRLQIA